MIALVQRYQKLDYKLECSIKAAADKVSRKDYGYQQSPALIRTGSEVIFWPAVCLCIRKSADFTDRVKYLAKQLGVEDKIYQYQEMSHKQAQG